MAATAFTIPLLVIDDKEARALADGVLAVSEQYNVVVNPKVAAWLMLVSAGIGIYGPRLYMLNAMKKEAVALQRQMQQERPPVQQSENGVILTESQVTGIAQPPIKFD